MKTTIFVVLALHWLVALRALNSGVVTMGKDSYLSR